MSTPIAWLRSWLPHHADGRRRLGRLFAHLVLVRVQLLGLITLFLLGLLSFSWGLSALRSALTGVVGWPAFLIALLAVLGALIATHTLLVTWHLAPTRFGVGGLGLYRHPLLGLAPLAVPITTVAALPIVVRLLTGGSPPGAVLGGIAAAALAAGAVVLGRTWIVRRLGRRMPRWLRHLAILGPGYVDPSGARPRLEPGHLLATLLVVVLVGIYAVTGASWRVTDTHFDLAAGSAAAYVLLWLLLVETILAGLAFFFDRYRVPILLVVIALGFGTGLVARGLGLSRDHVYRVEAGEVDPPGPDAALEARRRHQERRLREGQEAPRVLTLVAAEGGGIRAAAWTARVLSGLLAELPPDARARFVDSIHLVSGSSGGSVGLHFFLEGLDQLASDWGDDRHLEAIYEAAAASSLEASAWGLVYPDFARLVAGVRRDRLHVDRGWALERAWQEQVARRLRAHAPQAGPSHLGDWMRRAAAGTAPGAIFNGTFVEDGQPALLSTLDLGCLEKGAVRGAGEEGEERPEEEAPEDPCPGGLPRSARLRPQAGAEHPAFDPDLSFHLPVGPFDLPLATAARLSATFPLVSPAAHAVYAPELVAEAPPAPRSYHVVDGGYFDNFGLFAILHWIHALGPGPLQERFERIVVLRIEDFRPKPEPTSAQEKRGGWLNALRTPLRALLRVRGSSQRVRNEFELGAFGLAGREKWSCPVFAPQPADRTPPLSWALSREDLGMIDRAWEEVAKGEMVAELLELYTRRPPRTPDAE